MAKQLWVEKYRPQSVEDYLFQDKTQKLSVLRMVAEESIPHLLLSGIQGTGKTTLAFLLLNELEIDETDYLIVNASDENSVDTIRDKIKNFISTFALGKFKVVILEEADYLSQAGQGILRRMMEEYSDVARFILTCNYEHKIKPAIKSRCQQFKFKSFDKDNVAERVAEILATEKIKFTIDLVDKYVAAGYPDIRKIINLLEQNSIDGVLHEPQTENEAGDYKFRLLELLETDQWVEIRKLLCANVSTEEWDDVYKFLYENLNKAVKFSSQDKWEAGIVVIADHLYKHGICADPEINFAACAIRLSQL